MNKDDDQPTRVRVDSRGRISIPVKLMRGAGFRLGDRLQVNVDERRRVVVTPVASWTDEFAGSAPDAMSVEEIREMREEWDR
jgi:bifunctional DNA-binding transcriptional regulator/antitoxin component of YhaV-PrlF toxin-antitoxin module